jgi:hypothetical protein
MAILDNEHQDLVCQYLVEPIVQNGSNDTMEVDVTKEHYISQFKSLLDLLQQFVCKRLLSRSPSPAQGSSGFSPNSDPAVIDATKCIAVLCKYRKRCMYIYGFNSSLVGQTGSMKKINIYPIPISITIQ